MLRSVGAVIVTSILSLEYEYGIVRSGPTLCDTRGVYIYTPDRPAHGQLTEALKLLKRQRYLPNF